MDGKALGKMNVKATGSNPKQENLKQKDFFFNEIDLKNILLESKLFLVSIFEWSRYFGKVKRNRVLSKSFRKHFSASKTFSPKSSICSSCNESNVEEDAQSLDEVGLLADDGADQIKQNQS